MHFGMVLVFRGCNHVYFMAVYQSTAPETKPAVIQRFPRTPAVKLFQEIQLLLSGKLELCGCDVAIMP